MISSFLTAVVAAEGKKRSISEWKNSRKEVIWIFVFWSRTHSSA